MDKIIKLATAAVILALGMILSSVLLSKLFVRIRHEQAIAVKGYAEQEVVADIGQFSCMCTVRANTLKEAYAQLQENKAKVLAYLKKAGVGETEIAPCPVDVQKVYKRDANGRDTNEVQYYDASATVRVTSRNVVLVRDTAIGIMELTQDGIDLRVFTPEFLISDLAKTKMNLLAAATADGYRRAVILAENSAGSVGALIAAQQGVFQITQRHSTDTSGAGEYDTSTIEKTAKAVVTLQYEIRARK